MIFIPKIINVISKKIHISQPILEEMYLLYKRLNFTYQLLVLQKQKRCNGMCKILFILNILQLLN